MQYEKDFEIMQISSAAVRLLCTIHSSKTEETLLHLLPVELLYQILLFSDLPPHVFVVEHTENINVNHWSEEERKKAKIHFSNEYQVSEFALCSFRPIPHPILAEPRLYHPFFVDNSIVDETRFSVLLQHSIHYINHDGEAEHLTYDTLHGEKHAYFCAYLCNSSSSRISHYNIIECFHYSSSDKWISDIEEVYSELKRKRPQNRVIRSKGFYSALEFYVLCDTPL